MDNQQSNITQRRKNFLINVGYWAAILIIGWLSLKYLLPVLLPFILGLCIACILNSPIRKLSKNVKWKRNLYSLVFVLLFFVLIGLFLFFIGYEVYEGIHALIGWIPEISNGIDPSVEGGASWLDNITKNIEPSIQTWLNSMVNSFANAASSGLASASKSLLSWLGEYLSKIPRFFMNLVLTIISTIFFTFDYERIVGFIKRQLSSNGLAILSESKKYFGQTLPKVILSYCLIFSITFCELWLGLAILSVEHAMVISFIIAVLDILPILGTGTVLWPWAVISLVTGNFKLAIGLPILYCVITVVRQIIEPKIVGSQIDLHPMATLASMVIGLTYGGFAGMLCTPLFVAYLNTLNRKGLIHIWK